MTITLDRQTVTQACPDCGVLFSVVRGSVYHDGSPCGLYLIALHGHSPDGRLAHLAVTLLDQAEVEPRPRAVALDVFTMTGQFGFRFVPWSDSPWGGEAYLGELHDPTEARSSPYRGRFFEVAERVVEDLPEVRDYFR
jgi:hypothetical protein